MAPNYQHVIRKKVVWGILGVLVLLLAFVWGRLLVRHETVDGGEFLKQLGGCLHAAGFTVIEERSAALSEIRIPWRVSVPTPFRHGSISLSVDEEDFAEQFLVRAGENGELRLLVRIIKGRVRYLKIVAHPSEREAVNRLRSALAQKYPGLPLAVQMD